MSAENKWIWNRTKVLAEELNFSACGCTKATEVSETTIDRYNERLSKGYFAEMSYLKRNCEKRFNPTLLEGGTQSLLLFLAPFGENKYIVKSPSKEQEENKSTEIEKKREAKISQYAMGQDYHKVIKDKLFYILKALREEDPSIKGRPFVDSAPLLERYWAARAGLGFIGKNNFLISPECGIRNFIGVLCLNKELPYSTPIFFTSPNKQNYEKEYCITNESALKRNSKIDCRECDRCLKACPTGALEGPYMLNANKCTSYLTIEATYRENAQKQAQKGTIKRFDLLSMPNEAQAVNGWLFGCDECMNACPWNSKNRPSWSEFLKDAKENK